MPRDRLLQVRRGTAAAWTSANPTLAAGEFGFETDTGKVKIGDGSTAWNSLGYLVTGGGAAPTGAAGGVLSGTYPNPGFAVDMATQAELDAHTGDTSAAHAASAISFTPASTISSTDVQSAIEEVAAEAGAGAAGPGTELDYAEKTTNTTISGTTSAGATTIVTGTGFTADGSTRVKIEFWAYAIGHPADGFVVLVLYEGSTELGAIWDLSEIASGSTTSTGDVGAYAAVFLSPASGSRTYSVRGYRNVANVTVFAGDGSAGNNFPCWIRVTVA